jgi:hypothetical protein
MKTLFSLFICLIITLPIQAEESLTYSKENKSEEIVRALNATITNVKLSPDHSLRAVLYESQNALEEGDLPEQVLKIALLDGHLWLRPGDLVNYSKLKFLDNRSLTLSRCTLFVCESIIVDTLDRKVFWLGKGEDEIINNSLIKLTNEMEKILDGITKDSLIKLTNEMEKIIEYSSIKEQYQSPDNKSKVILYRSNKTLEEGEVADEILNFTTDNDSLWLYGGYGQSFYDISFLDNANLIFQECNFFVCGSAIFNFHNKKITLLGGGSFEIINDKYIRLNHSKSYDENGAYWIDKLVNYQGDLIKVISGQKSEFWKCKPLVVILDGYDVSSLEQSLDECIHVFR